MEVATISLSKPGSFYGSLVTTSISCITQGASITYTTDGSEPTTSNANVIASGDNVVINKSSQLKLLAYKSGYKTTAVHEEKYFIQKKIVLTDGVASDWFGRSVSISGDKAIVGTNGDDDKGNDSGSASFYQLQSDGSWSETKLVATDG